MINQILEVGADDELANSIKLLNKLLDEIMLVPQGPKRWRAVVDILHKTNPIAGEDDNGYPISFREVNRDCVLACTAIRETADDDYGGSGVLSSETSLAGDGEEVTKHYVKNKAFRGYLNMPRIVKTTIEVCDPDAFREEKNAGLMFKAFPEYRTARKFWGGHRRDKIEEAFRRHADQHEDDLSRMIKRVEGTN